LDSFRPTCLSLRIFYYFYLTRNNLGIFIIFRQKVAGPNSGQVRGWYASALLFSFSFLCVFLFPSKENVTLSPFWVQDDLFFFSLFFLFMVFNLVW